MAILCFSTFPYGLSVGFTTSPYGLSVGFTFPSGLSVGCLSVNVGHVHYIGDSYYRASTRRVLNMTFGKCMCYIPRCTLISDFCISLLTC